MCVSEWVYAHECRCLREPKEGTLELELQEGVSCLVCILGMELASKCA